MVAIGTQLGRYEIVAPLGKGGMGEVYRAKDTRLGRTVAIKVLPEDFAQDPVRLARFEREAKAVAALSHPNILAIYDYGSEQGVSFAVMELLEGETLRCRLTRSPLPWRQTLEIGIAIAAGLTAAHAKGIVHRDLKPENLFLTADGRMKILDFGLAHVDRQSFAEPETGPYVPALTESGTMLGTAGYMAPEQVRGLATDGRSDIFSLGCVLYEMIAGKHPFQRGTHADTLAAILHEQPPDLPDSGSEVPPEVECAIRRCLAKKSEERFQSSGELTSALQALLAVSESASSLRATEPYRKPPPRRWLLKATGAMVVIAALAAIAIAMHYYPRMNGERATELITAEGSRNKPGEEATRPAPTLPGSVPIGNADSSDSGKTASRPETSAPILIIGDDKSHIQGRRASLGYVWDRKTDRPTRFNGLSNLGGPVFAFVLGRNNQEYYVFANSYAVVKADKDVKAVLYQHTTYVQDLALDDDDRVYFSESHGAGADGKIYRLHTPQGGAAVSVTLFCTARLRDLSYWGGHFAFARTAKGGLDTATLYLSSAGKAGANGPAGSSIYRLTRKGDTWSKAELVYRTATLIGGMVFTDPREAYYVSGNRVFRFTDRSGGEAVLTLPDVSGLEHISALRQAPAGKVKK